MNPSSAACPLIVDMDGTLLLTDTLHEGYLTLLRQQPLRALALPLSLLHGKAALKQKISQHAKLDIASLPVNEPFLAWLHEQKNIGRKIILCTAADQKIADQVAAYFGIFDEVIASDGTRNLKAQTKADCLIERYDHKGFDYAGNDIPDLAVFAHARTAIVVNASHKVQNRALALNNAQIFPNNPPTQKSRLILWLKLLRIHQWKKNILLLAAPMAGHLVFHADIWPSLILAFCAFSLAASCVYIMNDLLDLESDRHHPNKRYRPLASGQIPILYAVMLVPLLILASLGFSIATDSQAFSGWLLAYFFITSAYSLFLKKIMLLDCIVLAILYVLRVIAGSAIISAVVSSWLLAFSLFLFLSLAFIKRYAELELGAAEASSGKIKGRGYQLADISLIQTMGVTAGFMSVLILALYLNSPEVRVLYHTPQLLWLTIPVVLYWISYLWMQAHRGHMHDDPVVFATRDPISIICGAVFMIIMALAGVAI